MRHEWIRSWVGMSCSMRSGLLDHVEWEVVR